ncbi:uncharacterized protein LOC132644286 [Lycium barbarum]|uniref:uncharacterized protein LOC132644286 n=1 Tax=Lycium barbarum TaxID=112863 RepID=UPI00293EE420|nr:uncharacterized protein LOC132644286 [Lycium barbarum]
MFFYLTTLSLQKFIKEVVPVLPESTPENERFVVTEAWKHSDFLCKNYILSGLEDDLYNSYSNVGTSKELCDALEKKYKTEDAGLKKFIAAKFLGYKMVDGLVISGAFQVAAVIEKLPPSWKDFKNYLKHKRKEMILEDLIVRLRIEEDNKAAEKKANGRSAIGGAHIIETDLTNLKKRKKASGPRNYPNKKKFKGNCHNCGKIGHKALVGNSKEWWIDSGATRHICAVREAFASYAPAGPDETIFMGNSATAKIEGCGKILLKMTSGKVVTLNDVCHVPEIRKNLVFTGLLVKNDFKCVYIFDQVVISKNEMYIGKGYLTEGLFKLNVMVVDNNNVSASSYLLESNDL